MFLVDRQTVPATEHDAPPTRLKLRVRGDGQIIELAEGKTTIGSSPRCNLRLDRPGIEPLHCLLMDGPTGLRVRRWAADTRLNGEPVEEASLEAGDCLALGGVELELVGPIAALELVEEQLAELVAEQAADDEGREDLWGPLVGPLLLTGPQHIAPAVEVLAEKHSESEYENEVENASSNLPLELASTETEFVEVDAEAACVQEDVLPEIDAAELVFRELQSACSVARGRNRKLLAALRSLRTEKESLVRRLENDEPGEEFAENLASWDAARQQAELEQRELHVELKELRRQLGEWESRLAEHAQQMAGLKQELVATRASGQPVVEQLVFAHDVEPRETSLLVDMPYESQFAAENRVVTSEACAPLSVDAVASIAVEQDVISLGGEVREEEQLAETASLPSVFEESRPAVVSADAAEPWDLPIEQDVDRTEASARSDHELVDAPVEDIAEVASESDDPWDMPTERKTDWTAPAMPSGREDAVTVGENSSAADEGQDDLSPFAEFSIWKQGALSGQAGFEEPAKPREAEAATDVAAIWGGGTFGESAGSNTAEPETENPFLPAEEGNPWAVSKKTPAVDASPESVRDIEAPVAAAQPASFIERYSHLFAEEADSASAGKVEPFVPEPVKPTLLPARALTGPAPKPTTGGDDEESIEQYMAKLMKRVRGDNPVVAASQGAPVVSPSKEESCAASTDSPTPDEVDQNGVAISSDEVVDAKEEHADVAVNWDAFVRRAVTAPATDLGALRALANATARRDINVHQLKKHRRDTKTKVIVSTLAGMTSLWLMLDAGNWRSLQFITACISLLVAAWWAGEAFREMLRSMRVTYVGPGAGEVDASLPIDVEG